MAADRAARGRGRAYQVLAFDAGEKYPVPRSGRCRQIALAHRARLRGTQARGRPRTFRRAQLARLPPSRHAVHRGLRIPDLRTGDDSPLSTSFRRAVPATCLFQRLPTPRRRHCGLNATSPIPSQQCADVSSTPLSSACCDAHAATQQPPLAPSVPNAAICDTVVLDHKPVPAFSLTLPQNNRKGSQMFRPFAEWLASTQLNHVFQEQSTWLVPTSQSIHIISVCVLFTSAILISMRILGVTSVGRSVSQLTATLAPWMWGALGVLL